MTDLSTGSYRASSPKRPRQGAYLPGAYRGRQPRIRFAPLFRGCRRVKKLPGPGHLVPKTQVSATGRRLTLGGAGTLVRRNACIFRLGQREGRPMQHYGPIWDIAAATFIAVSVLSGMAYIIVSALH